MKRVDLFALFFLIVHSAHASISATKLISSHTMRDVSPTPTATLMPTVGAVTTNSPTPTSVPVATPSSPVMATPIPATVLPSPTSPFSLPLLPSSPAPAAPSSAVPSGSASSATAPEAIAAAGRVFNGVYSRRQLQVTVDASGRVRVQYPDRPDAFGTVVASDKISVDLDGHGHSVIGRFHDCVIDWADRRGWSKNQCGEGYIDSGMHMRHPPQHRPWDPSPSGDSVGAFDGRDSRSWSHSQETDEDDDDDEDSYRGHWSGRRGRHHHRRRIHFIITVISTVVAVLLILCAVRRCRRWRYSANELELPQAPMMQLPQALIPQQIIPPPSVSASPMMYYPNAPPSALQVNGW